MDKDVFEKCKVNPLVELDIGCLLLTVTRQSKQRKPGP